MPEQGVHSAGLFLRLDGPGSLTERVYREMRQAIVEGRLRPGAQVPASRQLAADLGVSRKVVATAYGHLVDEGYLDGRHGAGTFVGAAVPELARPPASPPRTPSAPRAFRPSAAAARLLALAPWPPPGSRPDPPPRYDFQYGVPALTDFPQEVWSRLVAAQGRRMSLRALRYGRALGLPALREAIAGYVGRSRGVVTTAEQVIILNGAQQALDLLTRLLVDAGDRVVIEEPGYQAARQVFQAAGAAIAPVPVDADGLVVDALPRGRARLAYVTPSHQFPLGGVLPLERRVELLRWARTSGAYVVEDDYDSEFRYEGRPVAALQGLDRAERVLYIGTFSKVLFPALRIAYLVVPRAFVTPVASLKFLTDYHTPTFEQDVLAAFIRDGHFERHLRRCRRRNALRRAALIAACRRHLGAAVTLEGTSAGVHAVGWIPGMRRTALPALIAEALARGVGLYPVTPYYLRPPTRAGLLFGYACLDPQDIDDGIARVAQALDAVPARASAG